MLEEQRQVVLELQLQLLVQLVPRKAVEGRPANKTATFTFEIRYVLWLTSDIEQC